jgi:ABC-type Fe3+/spermidine/putrescine transport system ATPase subunit
MNADRCGSEEIFTTETRRKSRGKLKPTLSQKRGRDGPPAGFIFHKRSLSANPRPSAEVLLFQGSALFPSLSMGRAIEFGVS